MPEFNVHTMWPFPVYTGMLPVKEEWKTHIKNLKYERTHIGNSDISEDKFIFRRMPDLQKELRVHIDNYTRKFLTVKKSVSFYMQNSWCNIHQPDDASQIHYHANALLSGVYYPILPKNSGDLVIHKPNMHNNVFHGPMQFNYDDINNITCEQYVLELSEGSIVIFPSHLNHSVQKNLSNENRYSIAFNLFCRGIFGKEEYQLDMK